MYIMRRLSIINGRVITPSAVLENASVITEDGRIVAIEQTAPACPPSDIILDAEGMTVAPGYIDVHAHGGAGHDTMDATPEALSGMAAFFAAHGVTSFLPTTVAASHDALLSVIDAVFTFMQTPSPGARPGRPP
jgi:N-acetylglucosamine-6-phosphate deacetylase